MQHLLRSRSAIVVTIVNVLEPGARRDPQVGDSGTAFTVREEVETSASEDRAAPFVCAEIKGVRDSDHLLLALQS